MLTRTLDLLDRDRSKQRSTRGRYDKPLRAILIRLILDLLHIHLHAILGKDEVFLFHLLASSLAHALDDAVDDEADGGEDADEEEEEDKGEDFGFGHGVCDFLGDAV